MNFSLLNVVRKNADGTLDGYWMQDCSGSTYQDARTRAMETERANSNRIQVAVIEQILYPVPGLSYWRNRRLAVDRG